MKKSSANIVVAILLKRGMKHIGNIGLHHIDWIKKQVEFGIVIGLGKYWNQRIGAEAIESVTQYNNLRDVYVISRFNPLKGK